MKKVLLLNPPAKNYFIRDYYCSHISKGAYYWPPLDLLVLSGMFKKYFEVYLLDAFIQRISSVVALGCIKKLAPDFIISVAGAVSWNLDMIFLSQVKKIGNFPIVLSGDYPLAYPEKVIKEYPFIDAILLDFTDSEIIKFINGEKLFALRNVFTKFDYDNPIIITEKNFSIPIPWHNLFPLKRYNLPHIYYHPFATIMTDFGCLFHCAFCPFERIGYKTRNLDNIAEELEYIISLGIRELWLRDQSFGSLKNHALNFCNILKKISKRFSWSCEMRVDAADEELLKSMKDCGCHTVMFGVETADEGVLRMQKKEITKNQVRKAFNLTKRIGLRTLAHFIFGLNGENLESEIKLIDFCLSLDPDYASFNIATPLWNTSFREEVINNNWLIDEKIEVDSSCSYPVWETGQLKRSEIWQIRKLAIRRFYLRPYYFLNKLKMIKTCYQLYILFKEGLHLLANNII